MKTTINIDEDVLDRARELAGKLGASFRFVINDALRAGLDKVAKPAEKKPYHTTPRAMGLRRGYSLDNVQELLSRIDGESSR